MPLAYGKQQVQRRRVACSSFASRKVGETLEFLVLDDLKRLDAVGQRRTAADGVGHMEGLADLVLAAAHL